MRIFIVGKIMDTITRKFYGILRSKMLKRNLSILPFFIKSLRLSKHGEGNFFKLFLYERQVDLSKRMLETLQ